jgi:transcription initiation factor TFIIIB Brf1 subunit/transcription initiation factor TFIIB
VSHDRRKDIPLMAMSQKPLVDRVRKLRSSLTTAAGGPAKSLDNRQQLIKLRQRVADLEDEVIENRQLARRIAELTDVVEQLLLPEDVRDSGRLEARLGQIRARH